MGMSRIDSAGTTQPALGRLDGPVLVSNLVSGAFWLVVIVFSSWPPSRAGVGVTRSD